MTPDNQAYLTPAEVAERLKVTEESVRRWLRDGRLRGSLLGRVWRIGDRDLDAFMERSVPSDTPPEGKP